MSQEVSISSTSLFFVAFATVGIALNVNSIENHLGKMVPAEANAPAKTGYESYGDYEYADQIICKVEGKITNLRNRGQVGFIARDGDRLMYLPIDEGSALDAMTPPKMVVVQRFASGLSITPVPE